jgi:hypothetical protein
MTKRQIDGKAIALLCVEYVAEVTGIPKEELADLPASKLLELMLSVKW